MSIEKIRRQIIIEEDELRRENIFQGAGTILINGKEEVMISTNGALEIAERMLRANGYKFITILN